MATFEKVHLSGSSGGAFILPSQTASPGATLHSTGTSTTVIDEITLTLANMGSSARTVRLEWGAATANAIVISLDPYEVRSFTGVLSGTGSAARSVLMWTDSASSVNVTGWVNRITP